MMREIVITVNGAKAGDKLPFKENYTLRADFFRECSKERFSLCGTKILVSSQYI